MALPQIGYIERPGRDRDDLVTLLRHHQMIPVPIISTTEYVEARSSVDVDLLIFSIRFGDFSPMELAREVQSVRPIPLIILCDFHSPVDKIIALEAGCDDIVSTPYHPKELIARIRALLRRK